MAWPVGWPDRRARGNARGVVCAVKIRCDANPANRGKCDFAPYSLFYSRVIRTATQTVEHRISNRVARSDGFRIGCHRAFAAYGSRSAEVFEEVLKTLFETHGFGVADVFAKVWYPPVSSSFIEPDGMFIDEAGFQPQRLVAKYPCLGF